MKHYPVGIDDMAFYAPSLYLDLRVLAEKRNIPFEKLSLGLGLQKMAICDIGEDAATMAAEAIIELIERNQIDPRKIGRIYLGTESALDMAKPTGTYAVEMVAQRLSTRYGADCFLNCDVLDMTFACIGAADALQNTLDWAVTDKENMGIVVASDIAKYELQSSGEYTQGAGAVAMLVKWNPRLMVIRRTYGVAMESVHDFYKPRRAQFTETPIFDGQFSNHCYQLRMEEALANFCKKAIEGNLFKAGQFQAISERWARMIFHLPYAFHAKRMYIEQFVRERKAKNTWDKDSEKYGFTEPEKQNFGDQKQFEKAHSIFLKMVGESALYRRFVQTKLEKAQRASQLTGNLYTASIFLALMSTLESDLAENGKIAGKRFGFIAYGSGSKAKIFEGIVGKDWRKVAVNFNVFEKLNKRQPIDYDEYEALHTGDRKISVAAQKDRYRLERIGHEGVTLGARYYSAQTH